MTTSRNHTSRNHTPPPRRRHTRLSQRYQVRVPLAAIGLPRRAVTRYAFTYRAALRIAEQELAAAWSVAADDLPVASVKRWDRKEQVYLPPVRFDRPELDRPMVQLCR